MIRRHSLSAAILPAVFLLVAAQAARAQDEIVIGDGEVREIETGFFEFFRVQSGGELRFGNQVDGGTDDPTADGIIVESGGLADVSGGFVGFGVFNQGGRVALTGGELSSLEVDAGEVVVTGGAARVVLVGDVFDNVASGDAVLNVLSGDWQEFGILIAGPSGSVNLRGSRLLDTFDTIEFSTGSGLNLYGTGFSIDGVPVDFLAPDQPLLVDQRDVTIAGILEDGTPFSFLLSDGGPTELGFVNAVAGVPVTLNLVIPEPAGSVLAAIGLLLPFRRR